MKPLDIKHNPFLKHIMHKTRIHDSLASLLTSIRPAAMTVLAGIILPALLAACAANQAPPARDVAEKPAEWRLSEKAEATYLFLRFEEARNEQDQEAATEALERLLELEPSPRIYLEGANYHWRQGRLGEARNLLKKGIENNPGNEQLSRTLALTYLAENRYDDAAVTLKSFLKDHPGDNEVRHELAAILIEGDKHAEALDLLEKISEEEREAPTYYYMAKARMGLGLTQKAIADLKSALELNQKFVEAWAELAYLYEVEKDLVKAENIYSRILELGETGREVWLRLIMLNIKLNNPEKAMAYYRQGPDDLDFALEAATAFLDEDFYGQARSILESVRESGDAPERVNFYMAVLEYEDTRDPQKALEFLRRIPEENAHFAQALRFRVQLHMELEQYDRALELAAKGRERYPDQPAFKILESRIYEDRGNLGKAEQALEEAAAKWPGNIDVLYSLGVIMDKQGNSDRAAELMEKIISIDPEHAEALNFLGYTLADQNRDLERALVMVRKALELKPGSGYITDSLAWVHYRMGNLQKAWEEIQKAVQLMPKDPIIWEHYGDIARELGFIEEARRGYRSSLELKPENSEVRQKLEAL